MDDTKQMKKELGKDEMVTEKLDPRDLAPGVSLAAGRIEYREAKKNLRVLEHLGLNEMALNDEYQKILHKKSTLPRQQRDAIVYKINMRAQEANRKAAEAPAVVKELKKVVKRATKKTGVTVSKKKEDVDDKKHTAD